MGGVSGFFRASGISRLVMLFFFASIGVIWDSKSSNAMILYH